MIRSIAAACALAIACTIWASHTTAQTALRPFTVKDDIEFRTFGNPYVEPPNAAIVSRDGGLAVVVTERGLLQQDRVENALRVYDLKALRGFVNVDDARPAPEPLWTIRKSTYRERPVICNVRWLSDSRSLAFLVKTEAGRNQLWIADVRKNSTRILTPADQDVTAFDIRDEKHAVYTVRTAPAVKDSLAFSDRPAVVITGRTLWDVLYPPDVAPLADRSELWAIQDGRPFPVRGAGGNRIPVYDPGRRSMSLSPDARSVALALPVSEVPKQWPNRFPPAPGSEFARLVPGPQDLNARYWPEVIATRYVVITLSDGAILPLTDAPTAFGLAWGGSPRIAWSGDSKAVVLPGTFLQDRSGLAPCLALATIESRSTDCVEELGNGAFVIDAQFESGKCDSIAVDYISVEGVKKKSFTKIGAAWQPRELPRGAGAVGAAVRLSIKQSLNEPPLLVAADPSTGKSRAVWDPNPQLKQIRLGEASIYRWKDETGRDWVGGLYKPVEYVPGRRYPLVVQTHGFVDEFRPNGLYPSGYAARPLAASGIAVLQVRDCNRNSASERRDEAACAIQGYESAIQKLVADGLADESRLGITGFSRTCYYVLSMLTTSNIHFKAASITDGVNMGYLQYLAGVDSNHNMLLKDSEAAIGAPPYGAGLEKWLHRSPEFNLDKVTAALQVVHFYGRYGLLSMWEPYALLRAMNKPVDFVILNSSQHVLSNPGARLASQQGAVDWFRFWLKDEEDPDPAKAEQYARWRELRNLQEDQKRLSPH